jgi:hypothetical protein
MTCKKFCSGSLLALALLSIGAAPLANAQKPRLGRPLDWSHYHVVATRGGPDHGASLYQDWRTYFRHLEIDEARAARERSRRPNGVPLAGLWVSLAGLTLLAAGVASPPAKRARQAAAALAVVFTLLGVAAQTGCGSGGGVSGAAGGDGENPSSSPSSMTLDWSLNTGGFGTVTSFPAKFSFDISSSSCSDVVYFTVDQAGAASTPNVIALTNIYPTCPGTVPTVKWGIALPFGAPTSPALSLDGSVLYVFESRPSASGGAILHAINVDNITASPGAYDTGSGTWTSTHTLAGCPCDGTTEQLFEMTFAGVENFASAPYVDYLNNDIYFGDKVSAIHRIQNVNTNSPTEDTTNFPGTLTCSVAADKELRSVIFVGTAVGSPGTQLVTASADGIVYRIDVGGSAPYTCIGSAAIGSGTAAGELTSPVVDVTNSKIFAVTGDNGAGSPRKQISLLSLTFSAGASPLTSVTLGGSSGGSRPRLPAFDESFYTTNSGNVYVGGARTGASDTYLIRLSYDGTNLGTTSGFAQLARSSTTAVARTSHVTVFQTGAVSNPEFAYIAGASSAYLFMNRKATGFAGTNGAPVAMDSSFAIPGGCEGGIIVDNQTAATSGGSATANIYFGTVGISPTTQSTVVQLAQAF